MILHDAFMTIHRAKYKLDFLQNERGDPTGMEYGFLKCCEALIREFKDEEMILCWEGKNNFRKKIFPDYKANRNKETDNPNSKLDYDRVDRFKDFLKHPFCNAEATGYEADDVIASLVDKLKGKKEQIVIYSNDKDLLQLIDDEHNVFVMKSFQDLHKSYKWTERTVAKKFFGLHPCEFPIFLSFAGDASDNIPGVKGIRKEILANAIIELRGPDFSDNYVQFILDYPSWGTSEIFGLEEHVQTGAFHRNMELIVLRRPDVLVEEPTHDESSIRTWLCEMDFRTLKMSEDCGVEDDAEF
jgi:5'-3' exonuclease